MNAHRGRRPPLPDPIIATWLLLDNKGLSFFHQSGALGDRRFWYEDAKPGRFEMSYLVRGPGLQTQWQDEPVDFRGAGEETARARLAA